MEYIDTEEKLEEFCRIAEDEALLALDTEFIRERTYYPIFCLLQISCAGEIYIVDPFEIEDMSILSSILENEQILKVFHAADQDLAVLAHATGVMAHPIFDTQIAGSLLGHAQQAGLGSLVSAFCGVTLKKGDSYTDWMRRPLTDSQLRYAAEDVIFLPELYWTMTQMLQELGRLGWLDDEFQTLLDSVVVEDDPFDRYKRLKRGNQLTPRQLAQAREVAAWRELTAQKKNIPRKWVLSDDHIVEAAKKQPKTIDDLFIIRGIKDQLSVAEAREVLSLMKKARKIPDAELPTIENKNNNEPNVDICVDLLSALTRLRARENGIAFQTLASHNDLLRVARGYDDARVLKGWRRKIVGEELLEIVNGQMGLSMNDNELVVLDVEQN